MCVCVSLVASGPDCQTDQYGDLFAGKWVETVHRTWSTLLNFLRWNSLSELLTFCEIIWWIRFYFLLLSFLLQPVQHDSGTSICAKNHTLPCGLRNVGRDLFTLKGVIRHFASLPPCCVTLKNMQSDEIAKEWAKHLLWLLFPHSFSWKRAAPLQPQMRQLLWTIIDVKAPATSLKSPIRVGKLLSHLPISQNQELHFDHLDQCFFN